MILTAEKLHLKIEKINLFQNLYLTIRPSEILGILGPNGCGKTTLLQTLAGLLPPSKGEICLNKERLETFHKKKLARYIGILFQENEYFFPETVLDYCSQGRYPHLNYFTFQTKDDAVLIDTSLLIMELHELKNKKMPYLSGGEKQRAKIATLLIQNPQIYLLDEPTNHLDLHYQVKILKHFAYLKTSQQKSIVMTLHDINLAAQYCDQILMLFPNGKTLYGKSEEILCEENLSLLYGHPIHKLHPHGFAPSY